MSDFSQQICDQKKKDAFRVYKSSGPTTADERELTIKAVEAAVDSLSASAIKLIGYGVPEDTAYAIIFNSINDKALLNMVEWLWSAFRPKRPYE